jgi:hypothetical protein
MEKHEIISLTLDQLIERFHLSPESFDYEDPSTPNKMLVNPIIIWQPKFDLGNSVVPDPNNEQKTVIITYSELTSEMSCYIFASTQISLSNLMNTVSNASKTDAVISYKLGVFASFRVNHRKFMKLKKLIQNRERMKENDNFMKKLCKVFPGTLDDHIFGRK